MHLRSKEITEGIARAPHRGLLKADGLTGLLTLRVDEFELDSRHKSWQPPNPKFTRGVLAKYAKLVSSADKGAYVS